MTNQSEGGPRTVSVEITRTDPALHTAPMIYIDGAQGIIANEQMVKFNLFQDRLGAADSVSNPLAPIERVVCARLVMSPATFKSIADWMANNSAAIFPSQPDT